MSYGTVLRPIPRARRKPKQYEAGRVCEEDGCTVRLSRYNKKDKCFNHQELTFPRTRGEPT